MKSPRENDSKRKNVTRTSFSLLASLFLFSFFLPKVLLEVSISPWLLFNIRWLETSQVLTTTGVLRFPGCLPWSPYNYFQLNLLFSAFLSFLLVLITTERVRLELHPCSTQNAWNLHTWESTHAISLPYHHFLLLLSWLWKLVSFKQLLNYLFKIHSFPTVWGGEWIQVQSHHQCFHRDLLSEAGAVHLPGVLSGKPPKT